MGWRWMKDRRSIGKRRWTCWKEDKFHETMKLEEVRPTFNNALGKTLTKRC